MNRAVWLGCVSYFLVGLATVVFGALMLELLQDYGRNYSSGGQLVFSEFACFFTSKLQTHSNSETKRVRSCLMMIRLDSFCFFTH